VRPIRIDLNTRILIPIFESFAEDRPIVIEYKQRRIEILIEGYERTRGFGIPFGGYFWLPFSLFVALRHKIALKFISLYHLFLTFGPPMLGLLFINGIHLAGILLRLNEIIFHVLFLIFMFVGIKDILKKLRENKKF
tara:strand:+ start:615 stop:1025 length:411 start_codon:yes stop_codon:yes gene_type:complete